MKTKSKILAALSLVVIMMLSLTACSNAIDMKKLEGTWGISTVDGKDFTAYCEENGLDPAVSNSIMEINGTSISVTGNGQTQQYKAKPMADGFELLNPDDTIFMSVKYDSSKKTLTYKVNDGTKDYEFVLTPYTPDANAGADAGADADMEE